ncbi:thioredoxin-like protein [Ochromonadaceae sp. CCMP2298]|nr:thioredoxin-like protein [Ochromonadaceae sp. CCMP2298]|eukprot:CAMPEP_0173269052 /NCGR_PEP_ID=MMETSP1142-20121109/30667_1 /TAXON_ID=483371 /ORGANISM="non described non described, Strain CCMP2298" /LENGTH=160 /DNA_ID=CAMNT_0014205361 /DNA_START=24 /DNA_END=506 /DNA_ORIENTATION=-
MNSLLLCSLLLCAAALCAASATSGLSSAVVTSTSQLSSSRHWASRWLALRGGGSATVTDIADEEHFDAQLEDAGDKLVVVDFSAVWCGPCKAIAPAYQSLSEQFTDVVFLKVDVDVAQGVAARYEVMSMPTFLFLKGGKVVGRFSGASVQKLVETIEELM